MPNANYLVTHMCIRFVDFLEHEHHGVGGYLYKCFTAGVQNQIGATASIYILYINRNAQDDLYDPYDQSRNKEMAKGACAPGHKIKKVKKFI